MPVLSLSNLQRGLLSTPGISTDRAERLDASDEYIAFTFIADRDGTIDRVKICVRAVVGSSPTYRVGIEGPATSSNYVIGDGTYLASGNAYADSTLSAGFQEFTLGAGVTVSRGDECTVTVRHQSGTIDGSNYAQVVVYGGTANTWSTPLVVWYTGTLLGAGGRTPACSVRYGAGQWQSLMGAIDQTNISWTSASSPLYRGNAMPLASSIEIDAVAIMGRMTTNQVHNVHLYRGSESSPVLTQSIVAAYAFRGGISGHYLPIAPTVLTGGHTWRVIIEPTTANGWSNCLSMDFDSADEREAVCGGMYYTTASTPGTWTDATNRVAPIVVVPSGIEVAASTSSRRVIGG